MLGIPNNYEVCINSARPIQLVCHNYINFYKVAGEGDGLLYIFFFGNGSEMTAHTGHAKKEVVLWRFLMKKCPIMVCLPWQGEVSNFKLTTIEHNGLEEKHERHIRLEKSVTHKI